MDPNRNTRHRHSIRLQYFDYSQSGAYFVTICTHERTCLFGDVVDGDMRLSDAGKIVEQCWLAIPIHFPRVDLDAFAVMPNHVHGIIVLTNRIVGAKNFSPLHQYDSTTGKLPSRSPSETIGSIVRGFKIGVTKWFRKNTVTDTVWQRNYYEHIIRSEESLQRIRRYVHENPLRWTFDGENPAAATGESKEAWLK